MNRRAAIALVLLGIIFVLIFISSGLATASSPVKVSFINIGQGDSALIQDGNGYDILIDGGLGAAGPTVVSYLRTAQVGDLDVMVASHADRDHINGLIDVLQTTDIPVLQVLYNGYPGDTSTWTNFASAVAAEGIPLTAAQFPQTYTWGSLTAHVLNPVPGLTNPDQNDVSVVVRVDNGTVNYLFTGDADSTVEAQMVARGTPVAAEVLKVGHHGSRYSSGDDFLSAVSPAEAMISAGQPNSYGHPDAETLTRLFNAGARIWRTDLHGNVVVVSDGTSYQVYPQFSLYFIPLLFRGLPAGGEPTPTVTATPIATGQVAITDLFYDGVLGSAEPDEYVEIFNEDVVPIQLQGWTLRDAASTPIIFTFPDFFIQPGQTCRVYTDQIHPDTCGFSYGRGSAIWNNSGDCATLRDSQGTQVDQLCYPAR